VLTATFFDAVVPHLAVLARTLRINEREATLLSLLLGHSDRGGISMGHLAESVKCSTSYIDLSDTKSKWFGESEKRIKSVFSRCRSLAGIIALCEEEIIDSGRHVRIGFGV
jgi:hypothetical protein